MQVSEGGLHVSTCALPTVYVPSGTERHEKIFPKIDLFDDFHIYADSAYEEAFKMPSEGCR